MKIEIDKHFPLFKTLSIYGIIRDLLTKYDESFPSWKVNNSRIRYKT